ncbi:MAG TPA: adenylate/guanylate cyclase domain-containing protein [Burkholderiales bacterium]
MAEKTGILAPKRLARTVGLGLTALLAALYLLAAVFQFEIPLLDAMELKTYDMRMRALRTEPPKLVTIAAIDERSLAKLGQWPWSRAILAKLVDRLDDAGAKVVAFDVFFPEPTSEDADREFARAIGGGRKVVLSTVFLLKREDVRYMGPEQLEGARRAMARHAIESVQPSGKGGVLSPGPYGIIVNIPELQRSAAYAGHINVLPDALDGAVRRAPLVYRYDGHYFLSSDAQVARAFLGGKEPLVRAERWGITGIQIGDRYIPTDEEGRYLVRYRGAAGTFAAVSISDILDSRVDPALLHDRVVIIGNTAQGIGDMRLTPYRDFLFPGVEVRANIIENLLEGEVLQRPGWMVIVDIAIIVALGLALIWLLPRLGVTRGAVLALVVLGTYLFLANYLFQAEGLWLNVVYPSILVALIFASTTLVRYFSTESEKRHIKAAFQFYVPPAVVEEIAADVGKLRLGGEKRDLTVLFSDIRGFTSLSESLAPEELVKLLNVYFTEMTSKVFDHKGSLDKYIGDAIMAVFGAPIADAQHARLACRAALDMIKALHGLRARWRHDGLPELDIGIGINTGPMIVGNMGSESRFNYTVVGDAVNLASRIESLNKVYGTSILLSEYTYEQVKDEFPRIREIDRVRVRGRAQVVGLYELIAEDKYADLGWLGEFASAYRLLLEGRHALAAERFEALHAQIGDPVSAYHARNCRTPHRRKQDNP